MVDLESITQAVASVNKQMKEQARSEIPRKYVSLLDRFRRLPLSLYLLLVKLPTGGGVSSFSFSDLGESPNEVQHFGSERVLDMINYPPVPAPPGLTVVFMRYRERLRVVIGYVPEAITDEEVGFFETHLTGSLKGDRVD